MLLPPHLRGSCRLTPSAPRRPSRPPMQLNLVVVRDDNEQPQRLPDFDVGPIRLGWSINLNGTFVHGFLE